MIQSIITALTVISCGVVNAMDVCLSSGREYACKGTLPKFTVPMPSFCKQYCGDVTLIIIACSIDIFCLVITLVLCIANKTRSKPSQLIFINLCGAHLVLFIFFLVDVTTTSIIVISFFVDLFLFISLCSVLVEAVAICTSIQQKDIPHAKKIVAVCCWGLPFLKSIITVAANHTVYSYKCGEYFLGHGGPLNTADIVLSTLLFLAIAVAIAFSVCSLCRASKSGKGDEEVWHRIAHISAIFLCFLAWVITLLAVGIYGSFGIVFIIFGSMHGIAIMVGFCIRHARREEFREQYTLCSSDSTDGDQRRSPSVSPLQNSDQTGDSKGNAEAVPIGSLGPSKEETGGQQTSTTAKIIQVQNSEENKDSTENIESIQMLEQSGDPQT